MGSATWKTFYFRADPQVAKAIAMIAEESHLSLSDVVNTLCRVALRLGNPVEQAIGEDRDTP